MMPVNLSLSGGVGVTLLSNAFIDNYMKYANDVQLKVYLYLLRNLNAGVAVDLSAVADYFNYSEKDVARALMFLERQGLVALEYDTARMVSGDDYAACTEHLRSISLTIPGEQPGKSVVPVPEKVPALVPQTVSETVSESITESAAENLSKEVPEQAAEREEADAPHILPISAGKAKASYTPEDLLALKEDPERGFLYIVAEQYLGRPLTESQMRSILFICKELHFSGELTDYLLQYCIGEGKKDFRIIEETAMNWAEAGVDTPSDAKALNYKEDEAEVRRIMRCLGREGTPLPQEQRLIRRWLHTYGFALPLIEEACNRAAINVEQNRFGYAESIMKNWYEKGVHSLAEVEKLDEAFLAEKKGSGEDHVPVSRKKSDPAVSARSRSRAKKASSFCTMEQRDFDYNAFESKLINN